MKTYIYKGGVRTVANEKQLTPGATVTLNEKDKRVQSLVAQGFLTEVAEKSTDKIEKK